MNKSKGSAISDAMHSISITTKVDELPPDFSPSTQPQPFIPLLAPFTYNSLPKLSGIVYTFSFSACQCHVRPYNANFHLLNSHFYIYRPVFDKFVGEIVWIRYGYVNRLCSLNFSASQDIMTITATD
ncbi:hypothetical protein Lalb_Chr19g0135841 [Lupinus albus]|uniref:Uncharacterized protein n=1 Tax=Lupinus albus TaxID=3870 RepID=A0A6A4NH95_LUPAL|nr:hypothetical protein Lalb_Chr19g0135841 [Lupinus albus]